MSAEHVFRTSGSTSAPRQWARTRRQMEQEARMILGTWAAGVTDILSFAPTEHSYGMILGQVGADVTRARLQSCSLEALLLPDLQVRGPTVILCIASTWTLLASLLKRLVPQVPVLVLHSASALPSKAYAIVDRYAGQGVTFIELLGSTETGAIAHRPIGEAATAWTVFEDVSLLSPVGVESRLNVHSPRIARAAEGQVSALTHQSDDWILAVGHGQFQWLGRASQLIKINGVRQDLGVLRAELSAVTQCQHLACMPLRDELRGEAYEVVFSSPTLTEASLAQAIERLGVHFPKPVQIRRVEHLPLSASGKPQAWAIQQTGS
ncbi:AMP-binding protein [Pseudomonas pergaminensis]